MESKLIKLLAVLFTAATIFFAFDVVSVNAEIEPPIIGDYIIADDSTGRAFVQSSSSTTKTIKEENGNTYTEVTVDKVARYTETNGIDWNIGTITDPNPYQDTYCKVDFDNKISEAVPLNEYPYIVYRASIKGNPVYASLMYHNGAKRNQVNSLFGAGLSSASNQGWHNGEWNDICAVYDRVKKTLTYYTNGIQFQSFEINQWQIPENANDLMLSFAVYQNASQVPTEGSFTLCWDDVRLYATHNFPNVDSAVFEITNEEFLSDGRKADRNYIQKGKYTYSATIKNTIASLPAVVSIALYDNNNKLIAVDSNTAITDENGEIITVHLDVDNAQDGMYIKTFAWDGKMKPIEKKETESNATKILIIGNSITQHDYSDSLGWYGTWGMAATSEDKDYVHRLESMIYEKDKNAKFMVVNVWDFERYFYDFGNIDSVKYKAAVDFDADIIITAFGANINNADNEGDDSFISGREFASEDFMNIVNYFNPNGDAKIIVGMTPLTKNEILTPIKNAATANNLPLVDMTELTDEKYTAKPYANAPVFGSNVAAGVLAHPGDLGMQVMAERYFAEVEKVLSNVPQKERIGEGLYYAFDDFRFSVMNREQIIPSSYDADALGGNINIGKIEDISATAPVIFKRNLNEITGQAVMELGFTSSNLPDGTVISLKEDNTEAVKLKIENNRLYAVSTKGNTVLIPTTQTTFYGIKAIINIDNGTYSVYINGNKKLTDGGFVNNIKKINNFCVETSDAGTGSINFNHMRIYKDFLINEMFLGSHSIVPKDWTVIGSGISLSTEKTSVPNDMYALYINDTDSSAKAGISKNIDYKSEGLWLEYEFFTNGSTSDFGAEMSSKGDSIIKIGANNLQYGYWKNGGFVNLYSMKPNLWYHAMIKIVDGNAKIYINHKLVGENISVPDIMIDNIAFVIGEEATGDGYIDSIIAKPMNSELPEGYVSKPVKPQKSSNILVGVQSCSLWCEGTHMGWDCITGYEERKPYLGYYDEGNSEVADWETKWMVEHGIDFQMYCWFRQGATNMPIARPINSYALHDGFFNGEYSNMLKFCIMWENENATKCDGINDFKTNIVPYWIENYFKDNRYLIIDNKPVIAFYSYNYLESSMGGSDEVKNAFTYLSDACKAEGFDGAYILVQSRSIVKSELQKIKDAGADAIFDYTLSASVPETQYSRIEQQKNLGVIDVIASPGTGFENTPWGKNTSEGFMNVNDFKSLLTNVKNNYIPNQLGLAERMITIDNWNEYSEGHMIAPTGINGFGYLDAIREVFAESTAHTDAIPTSEAQSRFQNLFVQNRKIPKSLVSRTQQLITDEESKYIKYGGIECNEEPTRKFSWDTFKYEYSMSDYYSWNSEIKDFTGNKKEISGTSTTNDPQITPKNFVSFDATNVKQVKVRMKTNQASSTLQIFFKTDSDNTLSEEKSIRKTFETNGEFVEFSIDTTTNPLFKGTITGLRIDPMETTGTFAIDYIRFMGTDKSSESTFSINGVRQNLLRQPSVTPDIMYVPAIETARNMGYNYSESLDGKYLQMRNISTDAVYRLTIGTDAIKIGDDLYYPLQTMAQNAGYTTGWDSINNCINIIIP